MAKKLLVKEPRTLDGKSPLIGEDSKVIYKESLIEDNRFTRAQLDAMNNARPDYLKVTYKTVETEFVKVNGSKIERVKTSTKSDEKTK